MVSLFFKKMDSCEDEESIAPEVASILLLLFLFFLVGNEAKLQFNSSRQVV